MRVLAVISIVCSHLAFGFWTYLPKDYFYKLIAVALVTSGLIFLEHARIEKNNASRYLGCWWIAGSISNLIDELFNVNIHYSYSETFIFIILLIITLKSEREYIKRNT